MRPVYQTGPRMRQESEWSTAPNRISATARRCKGTSQGGSSHCSATKLFHLFSREQRCGNHNSFGLARVANCAVLSSRPYRKGGELSSDAQAWRTRLIYPRQIDRAKGKPRRGQQVLWRTVHHGQRGPVAISTGSRTFRGIARNQVLTGIVTGRARRNDNMVSA